MEKVRFFLAFSLSHQKIQCSSRRIRTEKRLFSSHLWELECCRWHSGAQGGVQLCSVRVQTSKSPSCNQKFEN